MNPAILLLIWQLSQLLSRMRILFSCAEAMGAKRKTQAATARMLKSKVFRISIKFLLVISRKLGVKQAGKGAFVSAVKKNVYAKWKIRGPKKEHFRRLTEVDYP
jgi:hypothetical protein